MEIWSKTSLLRILERRDTTENLSTERLQLKDKEYLEKRSATTLESLFFQQRDSLT